MEATELTGLKNYLNLSGPEQNREKIWMGWTETAAMQAGPALKILTHADLLCRHLLSFAVFSANNNIFYIV